MGWRERTALLLRQNRRCSPEDLRGMLNFPQKTDCIV